MEMSMEMSYVLLSLIVVLDIKQHQTTLLAKEFRASGDLYLLPFFKA